MDKIEERINRVRENIKRACDRCGRNPEEVKLVVVTKSADFEAIKHVIKLGIVDLGENRVQQLKKVATQIMEYTDGSPSDTIDANSIKWHMIGHLQRNKVRMVLPMIHLTHSVDTLRLAEEISTAAAKLDLSPKILLQVNTSNEPQKYGVPVGAAVHLAEQIETLPNLNFLGLMTMAPLTHNKDVIVSCFARTKELFEEMKGEKVVKANFTELSMGMSSDYELAIEQGATIIRIGSAIFSG
jgi:hypothetical protein